MTATIVDHSLTYRGHSLRHLQHRLRLRVIGLEVGRMNLPSGLSYADFGCSNGFVTDHVRRTIKAGRACGFDKAQAHLDEGRGRHPDVEFRQIDLCHPGAVVDGYDVVTCFETLEHVGDLETAVDNVVAAIRPSGRALVTVPIEIGPVGIAKFAAKMALGYGFGSLPRPPGLFWRYLGALLTGSRISRFRNRRAGWGTHFGFDYRDLDEALHRRGADFIAWNSGTTRFYRISAASAGRC